MASNRTKSRRGGRNPMDWDDNIYKSRALVRAIFWIMH